MGTNPRAPTRGDDRSELPGRIAGDVAIRRAVRRRPVLLLQLAMAIAAVVAVAAVAVQVSGERSAGSVVGVVGAAAVIEWLRRAVARSAR